MGRREISVIVALLAVLVACAPSDGEPVPDDGSTIRVASFDFEESAVVAEIYVQALDGAGLNALHVPRVGAREIVLPALERGLIDVVPEYVGSALEFLGARPAPDPRASVARLRPLLNDRGIDVLSPSPAQSRNGLVVEEATATVHGLRTISDLRAVASAFTLGGPPECPERELCLPGLTRVYGLRFASFLPLDAGGPVTAEAVQRGTVDVGVLFTSDGSLADHDLVLLADDRRLQPAENLVPVVRQEALSRSGPALTQVLDGVSARLTTAELRTLNSLVRSGVPADVVAARWLAEQGIAGERE
jgi:osmoprotectant transport system substrate-binding protein